MKLQFFNNKKHAVDIRGIFLYPLKSLVGLQKSREIILEKGKRRKIFTMKMR